MIETKTIGMLLLIAIAVIGAIGIGTGTQSAFAACTGNPHDFDSGPTGNPHDAGDTGNPHDTFVHHGGVESDAVCNGAK